MKWVGILLISPVWGSLSTRLFLQSWLAAVNFFIYFLGFVRGAVQEKTTHWLWASPCLAPFCSHCYFAAVSGFWVMYSIWLDESRNHCLLGFRGAFTPLYASQIPLRVRKAWRLAMIPGSVEADILEQRVGARGI